MTHAEVIEGAVESVNDRGVRVNGEWLNFSKFHDVETPKRGDRVRLSIDSKGFILNCTLMDDQDDPVDIVLPDATATRLAVLQVAVGFAASRPDMKSADVLVLAERWLEWVNQ